MPFNLYIHLPFCRRKCPYCDFFKLVPKSGARSQLVGTLEQEISIAPTEYVWTQHKSPSTVYFGGGTPSLHPPGEIRQILDAIRHTWGISPDVEITLEANPETLNYIDIVELLAIGMNRLSIGAQSFTNRKLSLLYRDHSMQDSINCFRNARRAGFSNLSLDLIFGLPGETLEEWERDVQQALALEPEHISLYNLEYHERTPIYRWAKQGKWQPLSEDLEAEMYLLTHNLLTRAGFQHYEVSNFAKPGFRAIHNAGYWNGAASLGMGPSAFSFDGEHTRTANVADLKQYTEMIEAGRIPVDRRWSNSPREQIEEWISGRLRQVEGIIRTDADSQIGNEITEELWSAASELPEVHRELSRDCFRLTPEGWFVENEVLGFLFRKLEKSSP